jgi:hypothetical protein
MGDTTIKAGDRVRSYDFPDNPEKEAFFIEGVVDCILQPFDLHEPTGAVYRDCARYAVKAERRVVLHEEVDPPEWFFTPVNGVARLFGGVCNGVERIE